MKTQDIKNMGHAYLSVLTQMDEKKLDPVKKAELKGSHADRKDKDIDNDGDTDNSDVYLHKRRKAISANAKGKDVETMESTSNASKVFNKIAAKAGGGEKGKKMAGGLLNKMRKEEAEIEEATVTPKMIKQALGSAKAKAKPKDQVSLKKAPWDEKKESKTWSILTRIMEKAAERKKMSGALDDPAEIITKFADDGHTKGAGKAEPHGASQSAGEKGFVDAHGGSQGQDSGIDGVKAAKYTADSVKSMKQAPARPGDQRIGDKTPPKSG